MREQDVELGFFVRPDSETHPGVVLVHEKLVGDDELGGPLEDPPPPLELACEPVSDSLELGVKVSELSLWLSLWLGEPLPGGCWVVAQTGI